MYWIHIFSVASVLAWSRAWLQFGTDCSRYADRAGNVVGR